MKQHEGVWYPERDEYFPKMVKNGYYQGDIFKEAMNYINTPKVFYDIGAHVGLWSLMCVNNGFREIHAFEPNPETYACLQKNLKGKAYLYRYGVSQIPNAWMEVVEEDATNTGAVKLVTSEKGKAHATRIEAPCIHKKIAQYNIKPNECLVKIDTEGMEEACVLGMDKIIYALRPVVVVEQRHSQDALQILQDMGMQICKKIRKDWILKW